MKSHLKMFLSLLVVGCLISTTISANCTSTIQDYIKYLRTSDPGFSRSLSFQMSSMKAPAKYVGYSSGTLSVAFQGTLAYLYGKNAKTVFSDRTWCPELPPGQTFCFGYQKFDYRKADTFELSLFTNSTAKVVLNTWGNATYRFALQCKAGFLYGTILDNTGNGFQSISISKNRYQIPR